MEKKTFTEYLAEETRKAYTYNGAKTYSSTGNYCLDLFAAGGSSRSATNYRLIRMFSDAYIENPDLAMKALFYIRDVRAGLGERNTFRRLLYVASLFAPVSVVKNIQYIPEYGRWDDVLCLLDEGISDEIEGEIVRIIADTLKKDMSSDHPSLLAKWLPSINASSSTTRRKALYLSKKLNMSHKEYRKTLSTLRERIDILENYLRKEEYTFAYEHVPSVAAMRYSQVFRRNDGARYKAFLEDVKAGKKQMHADVLSPADIVHLYDEGTPFYDDPGLKKQEDDALEVLWKELPDYCEKMERTLVIRDGSGSMLSRVGKGTLTAMNVADAMTIYAAERMPGIFHNTFITFSDRPSFVRLDDNWTLLQKLMRMRAADEIASTNIMAVFELIYHVARSFNLKQEDLPERLIIISDMEFNMACEDNSLTNFEYAKQCYETFGYSLPKIVFWNVHSRVFPVTCNESGVVMISGYTPRIFEMTEGELKDPVALMEEMLNSPRYERISA